MTFLFSCKHIKRHSLTASSNNRGSETASKGTNNFTVCMHVNFCPQIRSHCKNVRDLPLEKVNDEDSIYLFTGHSFKQYI